MELLNAFTVDVEDYFHVSAFEKCIDRNQWDQYEIRVVANTSRILDLLDRHGIKATFFVLGWVAHRYPELVEEMHRRGHEVGSHGYWHRLIYHQSPEEFRRDLQQSRDVLVDTIGRHITAYRAPSFSITKSTLWALDILAEEGFSADCSVFPIHHHRYGIPDAESCIHEIATSAGPITEVPLSVVRIAGLNLPVGGGGYFRLFPLRWTLHWLAKINAKMQRPFVFYIHPWELDPDQPRIRTASRLSRFRHYVNLSKNESKLDTVLRTFRFGRLCDVIDQTVEAPDHAPATVTASRHDTR